MGAERGGAMPAEYVVQHVRDALATSEAVGQLDIEVTVNDGTIMLSGSVPTEQRRVALERCVEEVAPGWQVHNATEVNEIHDPGPMEKLP